MKVRQVRDNVFELTVTSRELSALAAAARMTRDAMARDPGAPEEAVRLLDRVVRDYDHAVRPPPNDPERGDDGQRRPPS